MKKMITFSIIIRSQSWAFGVCGSVVVFKKLLPSYSLSKKKIYL